MKFCIVEENENARKWCGLGVVARKGCTILRHNSSCVVDLGHIFWRTKPMYSKFLLKMTNLLINKILIFQEFPKNFL